MNSLYGFEATLIFRHCHEQNLCFIAFQINSACPQRHMYGKKVKMKSKFVHAFPV